MHFSLSSLQRSTANLASPLNSTISSLCTQSRCYRCSPPGQKTAQCLTLPGLQTPVPPCNFAVLQQAQDLKLVLTLHAGFTASNQSRMSILQVLRCHHISSRSSVRSPFVATAALSLERENTADRRSKRIYSQIKPRQSQPKNMQQILNQIKGHA